MTETMESHPSAEAALERVLRVLLASRLADKALVQSLRCKEARRQTYLAGVTTRMTISRSMVVVQEPLRALPSAASVLIDPWQLEWPPRSGSEATTRQIDVRQSYEVVPCARCGTAGRTQCAGCRGSGQVADAQNLARVMQCPNCAGRGTLLCPQCEGQGRLNRFSRILQTADTQKEEFELPADCFGVPKGTASGEVEIDQPLGFESSRDAAQAVLAKAASLNPERSAELAKEIGGRVESASKDAATRLGWVRCRASWYDGWELRCVTGEIPRNYFVPDSSDDLVGPRLHSRAKVTSLIALIVGIVLLTGVVLHYLGVQQDEAEAAARIAEVERERAEEEARLLALASEVPAVVKELNAAMNTVGLRTIQDVSHKEEELRALDTGLGRFKELESIPPELAEARQKLAATIQVLKDIQETYAAAAEAVQKSRMGDERVNAGEWLEADNLYLKAIELWATHPKLMTAIQLPGKDGETKNVDPAAEQSSIEKKRDRIALQVRKERARVDAENRQRAKEAAEAEALAAICGDKPVCSGWDGACVGIKRAVQESAHDPDSIEVKNCTNPILTKDHCWVTTCDVRGKNAFGALVLARKRFSLSKLEISEL